MASPLHMVSVVVLLAMASSASAFFLSSSNSHVMRTFTARDCGGPSAAMRFNYISATPRPMAIPGTMRIAFDIDVLRNITGPLKADIRVYRKINFFAYSFWMDITPPCLGDDCLTDMCAEFERSVIAIDGCPAEVTDNGFECTCPPPPRSYVTRSDIPLVAHVTEADLPHDILRDLINGDYRVHVTAFDGNEATLGCYEMEFGLIHRRRN